MFRKPMLVLLGSLALASSLAPSRPTYAGRPVEGAERPSTVSRAAIRYYVWFRYRGGRWSSEGPFSTYYEATRAEQDLNRSGAQTFIDTRPS